ncbi:MAG: 50S ribosomal protein L24 [Actinobacteria bacterium]|nr:MAG: 50S ribosomal protein L24 [Actinomycetota bacterium]
MQKTKMKIRKGDTVQVISGKETGKKGKVLRTLPEKQRVVVERLNMMKRHTKPTQKNPQGGIIEREASIPVSNVMLICPGCGQPSRLGSRREDGGVVRVCKKCNQDVDK